MLAKIIACQPAEPGTAQLMVRLRGEQALLTSLTFIICNNEQNYLQPDGSWSPAQHWFTIDGGYPLLSRVKINKTIIINILNDFIAQKQATKHDKARQYTTFFINNLPSISTFQHPSLGVTNHIHPALEIPMAYRNLSKVYFADDNILTFPT